MRDTGAFVDPGPGTTMPLAFVNPGDRLPGMPSHRFKAGADYCSPDAWKFGADLVAVSDQVFFGDEGNDRSRLAGYAKVDLRTSYDVTENIQIYGLVDNVFDARYGLFGTYFNQEAARNAGAAEGLRCDFFGTYDVSNDKIDHAGAARRGLRRRKDPLLIPLLTYDAATDRRTDCRGPSHPREEGLCL